MSTIARLNSSISDHTLVANSVALFVVAFVSIFSAAAIINGGDNVKSSFNTLVPSISNTQVPSAEAPASKAQIGQQTASNIILSDANDATLQLQPQNEVGQLQPAQNLTYNTNATANTLQPSQNSVMLAGSSLQNAAGVSL